MNSHHTRKGFTLIEVLVVIVILAALAAYIAPTIKNKLGTANVNMARGNMAQIENALSTFLLDCARYPDDTEGFEVLLTPPADVEDKWKGPYIKASQLLDPWNNPYQYMAQGIKNPGSYDIISFGADGTEGGEGDNADIFNE